jgi:nitrate/TMAO reductase-like tetraheme cytochrome c subunit
MKVLRSPLPFASVAVLVAACSSDGGSADESTYTREKLLDPATCNECHQQHYTEWSGSMHAYSSTDPIFRAMNQRGQEETKGELGDFCVKCHAPMAVAEQATTDGLNLDSLPKELQGVTCYFCHQATDVADTHNNPLLLANDTTMRGGIKDPVPFKAHKSEYSPLLDGQDSDNSSKMCGSCHDISVPAHFSGAAADVPLEQTYAEWTQTTFAVPGKQRFSCGDCHVGADLDGPQPVANPPNSKVTMPVRSKRHQHLFFAIDTAFGDFPCTPGDTSCPDKAQQTPRVQDGIDKSVRVQLCVQNPGGAIALEVENLLAGHNMPSGASHDRRMWAEVHVFDGDKDVYQAGVVGEGQSAAAANAASIAAGFAKIPFMSFWDKATKMDGTEAHMFWDVANIRRDSIPGQQPGFQPTIVNYKNFSIGAQTTHVAVPKKVTATLWLEPVGLDVIDDLIGTGHLPDDSIRKAMPRYAMIPTRVLDPSATATITWTHEATQFRSDQLECVQTTPKAN